MLAFLHDDGRLLRYHLPPNRIDGMPAIVFFDGITGRRVRDNTREAEKRPSTNDRRFGPDLEIWEKLVKTHPPSISMDLLLEYADELWKNGVPDYRKSYNRKNIYWIG